METDELQTLRHQLTEAVALVKKLRDDFRTFDSAGVCSHLKSLKAADEMVEAAK